MSAFICPMAHITLIAVYAHRNRRDLAVAHLGEMTAQEIGEELYAENVRSYNYRYGDHEPATGFTLDESLIFAQPAPVQVFKAVTCLDYQSCEHPGWEQSHARRIVAAVGLHSSIPCGGPTANRHPDYERAAWCVDTHPQAGAHNRPLCA